MFDFVRKKNIWDACDKGYLDELKSNKISYQLKHAQDLEIYRLIRDSCDLDIAEIGGGNSRILEQLACKNRCTNIEKFEGRDLGPASEIKLNNVLNINCYVGDFDAAISDNHFDLIFSISVVEHITTEKLDDFFTDSLRILKPGGRFIHAIDTYLNDCHTKYHLERFEFYRNWVTGNIITKPIGNVLTGSPQFSTDMISNPDNIMYGWNKLVSSLTKVREDAQSVSLIVGGVKI